MTWRSPAFAVLAGLLLWSSQSDATAGAETVESPDPRLGTRGRTWTILFSSETRGNLTPCRCPDGPWGGLARRVGYLDARKGEIAGPVLTLHGGGFVPVGAVPLRNDPHAEVQLVTLLMESLLRSEIDVLALEPDERKYLERIAPAVWSKLGPLALDSSPPAPPRVVSVSGTPVAILALDEGLDDATLEAAAEAARSAAEVVIVLARADGISGRRIAERTGADIVILSFGVRTREPVQWAGSWIVGAGREGREIGELRLEQGELGLRVLDYRLVPMDETVPVDARTDDSVRRLLDDFGPGWQALVTPIE